MELFVNVPVACINAAITNHFVMLFWDMLDKTLYKFHNWDSFFNILAIFMSVVMKSNKITIIAVNPGSGDYRPSKIAAYILHNSFWVTFIGFGIDVKAVFVFPVATGFYLFKGCSNSGFHFVEQGSTKSITKVCIVKMVDIPPETVIAVVAFRNEAVNVGIPF